MRAIALLLTFFAVIAPGLGAGEELGAAVKRSLDRSRLLYPDSTQPESPLSLAILARIEWLNRNNRAFFSDPDWPLKVTAAEAMVLGIRARDPQPAPVAPAAVPMRYLAVVTRNFSVAGASFRKGQQVVLDSVQDYGKRGTILVDDQEILLWLDNIKILREIPGGEAVPVTLKVESARYGFPGKTGYSVSGMIQSLVTPNASGQYEILVSDALLKPSAAQKLNRSVAPASPFDPNTGLPNQRPYKILTVTYTINGLSKTKQAIEGQTLVLD
ncbi:MAG: hypothetical protein ACOYMS_11380 [Terrimicrobiaceae bacterium]